MTASLAIAVLWAGVGIATARARLPWLAEVLIAAGIPISGWVTFQNGPIWGLLVLAVGVLLVRFRHRTSGLRQHGAAE